MLLEVINNAPVYYEATVGVAAIVAGSVAVVASTTNAIMSNKKRKDAAEAKEDMQREIIEQLLGITLLSQKADLLKEKQKATKQILTEEKLKIDAQVSSNEKIKESIESLKIRSTAWQAQKADDSKSFAEAIAELEKVDIKAELDAHKRLQKHNENYIKLLSLQKGTQKSSSEATSKLQEFVTFAVIAGHISA